MVNKLFYLATLMALGLIFACGSDDDTMDPQTTNCMESEFISKWRGDVACDSSNVDFQGFEFTLDIDSEPVFTYANFGIKSDFTVTRSGCDFTAVSEWQNNNDKTVTVSVEGKLSGSMIESTITRTIDGIVDEKCSGNSFQKY